MKFNLNDCVRARLSETGVKILNDRDRTRMAATPPAYRREIERDVARRKAGDVYHGQVWSMMDDFGDAMACGGMLPFIEGVVEIVTPEVRRADAERDLKRRMYRVHSL